MSAVSGLYSHTMCMPMSEGRKTIHNAAKLLSFDVPVKLLLTLTNENRLQVFDEWV